MSEKRTTTGVVRSRAFKSLDDFEQIDVALGRAVRPHHDVPGLVDAEVRLAPRGDLIQVERVLDCPTQDSA